MRFALEAWETTMRALVVEDDPMSQKLIQTALQRDGVIIEPTSYGEDAVELAKLYDFDIVLLDLTLPDLDGYDVIRRMRGAKVRTPVLILSGRLEVDDKVRTLCSGADDYVTKPFYPEELAARIQAVVRRSKGHSESVIRTGALVVNFDTRTVEVNAQRLHVTGKEYSILELLSLRKGVTLTKEMFLDHLYGGMDEPELKIIDVFICKLRKKIARLNGGVHYIETVWGRGYVLKDPDARPEADAGEGVDQIDAPLDAAAVL
jgi:two-component system cell cycle response regulator CtrA